MTGGVRRVYLVWTAGRECHPSCPQIGRGYCRLHNEELHQSYDDGMPSGSPLRCARCLSAERHAQGTKV